MDARTGLPIVGMVGGGQLARMTHQAAIALGQSLRVLATATDDSAAVVASDVVIGGHDDLAALQTFASGCDVLTFDHEHVPGEHIRALQDAGVRVLPSADALRFAQDKAAMRVRLAALGAPVPAFRLSAAATLGADAGEFAAVAGWPIVVKTASGGYDGRGVWIVTDADDIASLATDLAAAGPLVLEQLVPAERELAVLLARSPYGQAAAWPVVETVQRDGICVQVIAPATGLSADRAQAAVGLGLQLAADLDVVGVLAVELFQVAPTADWPAGLVVNELAMRPHNSGHWTMDGSITSQFEQHLRAVLDYPLGRTEMRAPVTVMGNVLGGRGDEGDRPGIDERVHHLFARFPQVKVHLYGKGFRPGRKLGHVNVSGTDPAELRSIAALAADYLGTGVWSDGFTVHQGDPAAGADPVRRASGASTSAPARSEGDQP